MKKIGFWLDHYIIGFFFKREGFFRFSTYLIKNLISEYNLCFEIWSFPANKKIIEILFKSIKEKYPNNIEFKTSKYKSINSAFFYSLKLIIKILFSSKSIEWRDPYGLYISNVKPPNNIIEKIFNYILVKWTFGCFSIIFFKISIFFKKIFKISPSPFCDDLTKELNNKSEASIFIIPIMGKKLSQGIKKKQLLILHDLVMFEFFNFFKKYENYKKYKINIIKNYIDILTKKNSIFVTHSPYVAKNQIKKNFTKIPSSSIFSFFLPILYKEKKKLFVEKTFNDFPYIFYPTQNRPYKNIKTLIKAFKIIKKKESDIKLVLTNSNLLYEEELNFINKHKLNSDIITKKDVSNECLHNLYENAKLTIVPTLFEGNFPLQAMESLFMNTPVLLSRIPTTLERLEYHNIDFNSFLFEPFDYQELANKALHCLKNKNKIFEEQKKLKDSLLKLTWKNFTANYYNIIKDFL